MLKQGERGSCMIEERMKMIAKRHADKSEKRFFKYLRWCGWEDDQITEMWEYVQKYKGKEQEK